MNNKTSFRELFASARATLAYKLERKIITFTEQVIGKMDSVGLSRTALAARLEASPSYVTKFLRGGTNFTLESMIRVAEALDCDLHVELVSKSSPTDWFKFWETSRSKETSELRRWAQMRTAAAAIGRGGMRHVSCPLPPQHVYQENQQDNF